MPQLRHLASRIDTRVPSTVGIFNERVRVRVHNTKIRFRFVVGFSRGHTRTKVRFTYTMDYGHT